jgi:hypothetical protein
VGRGVSMGRFCRRYEWVAVAVVAAAVAGGCSSGGGGGAASTRLTTTSPPASSTSHSTSRPHRRHTARHPFVPPRLALSTGTTWAGEGVWKRRDRWAGHTPTVMTTTYQPPTGGVAYLAWISSASTRLALYAGTSEPPVGGGHAGVAPTRLRARLLATFNGGFRYSAAPGGFIAQGVQYVPLQTGLATVWTTWTHHVNISRWAGGADPRTLEVAREDLTLLVSGAHPAPLASDVGSWGATLGGGAAVWRTALGIDAHHNLIYVAANDTPLALAQTLVHAGAVRALELDINPEWSTFNVYGGRGGAAPTMFVPNPQQSADRYLVPDSRDFFAVYAWP